MNEKDVIRTFVEHLKGQGNPGLVIDRWPDEENRTTEDIDALAGLFAIEHTSIDVNDDMRQKNDWFMKAAGSLEAELNPTMTFRLRMNFDVDGIKKGQDWQAIKTSLKNWIIKDATLMSDGFQVVRIPNVPFEVRVEKTSAETPALVFSRSFDVAQETLESSIKPLIERKARKLVPYTADGKVGILLIQSEDLAFMNHIRLAQAIATAFPTGLPEGVQHVWYADATIPSHLEFREVTTI